MPVKDRSPLVVVLLYQESSTCFMSLTFLINYIHLEVQANQQEIPLWLISFVCHVSPKGQ